MEAFLRRFVNDCGAALSTIHSYMCDKLVEVFSSGRFTKFRRATEIPFNGVFEAKL